MFSHFWQNIPYVSGSSRMDYFDKICLQTLSPKIRIPSDIVTHPARICEGKKQYFLVAPYVSAHISATLREMTTFRIITRTMKWQNIWVRCDPESREVTQDAASDSQRRHSLWDTRRPCEKISYTRIRGLLPLRAYLYPFPISPMSRVVFVSRRKVDARTHELTDFRGSGHRDCTPPPPRGLHRTSPAIPLASGAICVHLSLFSVRCTTLITRGARQRNDDEKFRRWRRQTFQEQNRREGERTDGTWNTPARQRLVV